MHEACYSGPVYWDDPEGSDGEGSRRGFKGINSSALSFLIVQLSYPYMTTGKTIALTRWTFVGKVMSLHFNVT